MKRLVSLLLAVIMVMSVFAIVPVTANAADTTTVYFQNNWMWTDVNVYYWFNGGAQNNGAWPGQPAQKFGNDGTYDIYSVTLPTGVEGVIFNGFDGGINAQNQTPDIKGFSNGNCYSMVWNGANDVSVQDISQVLPVNPTDPPIPTNPPVTQPQPTKAPETQPQPTQPTPTQPSSSAGKTYVIGDADGNGDVNIMDATTIQLYLAHQLDNIDADAANVDKDANVTIMDATHIQLHLAKQGNPAYNIGSTVTK